MRKLVYVILAVLMTTSIASAELTNAGKVWLVINTGKDNCFVTTGISYNDPDRIARIGGTSDVVAAFIVAHLIGGEKENVIIIADTSYSQFKTINDNTDLSMYDIVWVNNNDGSSSGESQYCVGPPPPVPEIATVGLTLLGLLGLFIVSRRR